MRSLPDADLSFRDALDYILDCGLSRRALADPNPKDLALFIRDAGQLIHRLTTSCHLAEFTDHGLSHLCSLLERISAWTSDDPPGNPGFLINRLSPQECATLLIAVLVHDIGMLSQRPDDLPRPAPNWAIKGLNDVPNWVRQTHILRIEGILRRGLDGRSGTSVSDPVIQRAIAVAGAHGSWPGQKGFEGLSEREAALGAILAIADLLDEDSNRCDIATLLNHRQGSQLNRAHWIRHGLTVGRINVVSDDIQIELETIPGADRAFMEPVFAALRNHFRLALMYRPLLAPIKAGAIRPKFNVGSGVPPKENKSLANWNEMPSFATAAALSFQLLNTFFAVALLDSECADPMELAAARPDLELVDLTLFRAIRGTTETRSQDEMVARTLVV